MDLTDGVRWLERYSVVILPALVVAEQIGIPLPAVPALLVVGALAAQGRVSLWLVIGAIAVVALAVDLVWHELGRRRGARVLTGLCRLTLEPDVCVRRTENLFLRHGVRALLVSKFLPGLTTVMPPLAGVFGISRLRFVLYDLAGIVLWAGLWAGIGYVFSETIEAVVRRVSALGHTAGLAVGGDPRRLRPAQGPASMALPPTAPDCPDLPGGPQAEARRRRGRRDPGPPHRAGRHRHPVCHSRQPLDLGRGARRASRGHPPGPGAGPLLLLTQRSHERPGGASAQAAGDYARPSPRRGYGEVDGLELPGPRAGPAGGPRSRRIAAMSRSWRSEYHPPGT